MIQHCRLQPNWKSRKVRGFASVMVKVSSTECTNIWIYKMKLPKRKSYTPSIISFAFFAFFALIGYCRSHFRYATHNITIKYKFNHYRNVKGLTPQTGDIYSLFNRLLRRATMVTTANGKKSASLVLCGNSAATDEFPSERPVTWSFEVFFDLCLSKRLSKQ